ncbi:SMI1/KNR4 family protein [Herbidospora daliensis]|uniref:SMI1/KNR4 family protein n=1 Tax=Herbidospora daliensis TaxID=295585 RepID=UPI000785803F|nr:SMI1/KNR4 family protein [Herbidospora daliensis]
MGSLYAWSDRFPEAGPRPESYDGPWFTGLRPGAGDPELRLVEERLGRVLPPTYRDFLRFSDGWDFGPEENVLGSAEVGWLRDLEPELARIWGPQEGDQVPSVPDDLYFDYGPEQNGFVRGEYVPHTLLVGHHDDGVYLLNPEVVTPEGEWEAWYLAPWLPGAVRARSFWELMQEW